MIDELTTEINEIEAKIKRSLIISTRPYIPDISYTTGAMIIAETGDFNNFSSPDKIFALSGHPFNAA